MPENFYTETKPLIMGDFFSQKAFDRHELKIGSRSPALPPTDRNVICRLLVRISGARGLQVVAAAAVIVVQVGPVGRVGGLVTPGHGFVVAAESGRGKVSARRGGSVGG
jgi:hypothetical protein